MKLRQRFLQSSLLLICPFTLICQQPKYTPKSFVTYKDTVKFKPGKIIANGLYKTYVHTTINVGFWDTHDDNTTHVQGFCGCLLYIESEYKNDKKNGITTTYLIDSLDNKKRYKISEQSYLDDKLNGEWRTFNLRGTLVKIETFKGDSLHGISRVHWVDGKRILEELEYFNGTKNFILREYDKENFLTTEAPYEDGILNGRFRKFYPNGVLKEELIAKNGKFEGTAKHYYSNGKLWTERIYKDGEIWTVLSNYDSNGKSRESGNLKNGNGTLFLYNDDGRLREVITYINGKIISNIKH